MRKKKRSAAGKRSADLTPDGDLLPFLMTHQLEGIPSCGAVPEDHKGPYRPSKKELIKGANLAMKARLAMAQDQAGMVVQRLSTILEGKKQHK